MWPEKGPKAHTQSPSLAWLGSRLALRHRVPERTLSAQGSTDPRLTQKEAFPADTVPPHPAVTRALSAEVTWLSQW